MSDRYKAHDLLSNCQKRCKYLVTTIARLEANRDKWIQELLDAAKHIDEQGLRVSKLQATIERLEAENARLRELLRETEPHLKIYVDVKQRIKAALAEAQPAGKDSNNIPKTITGKLEGEWKMPSPDDARAEALYEDDIASKNSKSHL